MTKFVTKSEKKEIGILYLLFFCFTLTAQSKFWVGASISPSLYHTDGTVQEFETYNNDRLSLSYGLTIDYEINKIWSISIRPSYFSRGFQNGCVDTIVSLGGKYTSPAYPYYISKSPCEFSTNNSYIFLELPVILKYNFKILILKKLKEYLFVGNSIIYRGGRKDIITNNMTHDIIVNDSGTIAGYYTKSWFSPILGGGLEFNLSKRMALDSEFYLRTEDSPATIKSVLFTNFTAGLNLIAKLRL